MHTIQYLQASKFILWAFKNKFQYISEFVLILGRFDLEKFILHTTQLMHRCYDETIQCFLLKSIYLTNTNAKRPCKIQFNCPYLCNKNKICDTIHINHASPLTSVAYSMSRILLTSSLVSPSSWHNTSISLNLPK